MILRKKQKRKPAKQGIRARIFRSYMVVIAVCALSSITALVMLWDIGNNLKSFYDKNYLATIETWNARYTQLSARCNMLSAMVEKDYKITGKLMEQSKKELEETGEIISGIRKYYHGDTKLIDNIEEERQKAMECIHEMMDYIALGMHDKAYDIMQNEYIPKVDAVSNAIEQVQAYEETEAKAKVNQATIFVFIALGITAVMTISGGIIAYKKGVRNSDSINKPIKELERASYSLAEGNLDVEISYNEADELGSLAKSMRQACAFMKRVIADTDYVMKEMANGNFTVRSKCEEAYVGDFRSLLDSMSRLSCQLSTTLGEIYEYSNRVAVGASHLAEGAQSLSEGTIEQSSAVADLTKMVEDIAVRSQKAVEITEVSYNQAVIFQQTAQDGREEILELLEAMKRINDTSSQIEKIIVEIEEIAAQTNLLSLNAAIEAARAGESGRGFAVVADQIGKLATQSAQSAENTKKLIQNSMKEVNFGNEITQRTSETLVQIVEGINSLAEQVKAVNTGVMEQDEFIKKIEVGVQQISEVIEQNAASAEESTATSEELSAQAENLDSLVGRFQIIV